MNETINEQPLRLGAYRPRLAFYHPNSKGTGGAVKFELHPAHDDTDGSIWMSISNQMSVGSYNGSHPVYARFDWQHSITVKLDFNDLCRILQVLRGECESIEDGRGLYHQSRSATTRILLRHIIEPTSGYILDVYRTMTADKSELKARILFNSAEALGICESISGALYIVSFGIPMLVPHNTDAYRSENRGCANANAVVRQ